MIYKRAIAKLRAQDWMAIAIEIAIVVVGVFIGTQVSNWNEDRLQKRETQRMLVQLVPQLQFLDSYFKAARPYYAVTRAYADTAIAGWHDDPKVSDRDFVIAAYQASQIFTVNINSSVLSTVMGAERLQDIEDPALREQLTFLLTTDYSQTDAPAIDTPYRRNVRRIVPIALQDAIRVRCGDREDPANRLLISLPATCDLAIPQAEAAQAARLLRAHPELMDDLQWHVAAIFNFLSNIRTIEISIADVESRLAASRADAPVARPAP